MITFVIAAPMSGSGTTTVTLGLMAALKRRGLSVAPFKVGPDFIDPGWHRAVTGRPSVNLDGWICPEGFVRETFAFHARRCDVAVVEGVMGLLDGIDACSDAGSTAQVAKILDAPVILVVDARSQARSAAALVQGFAGFDTGVTIAGVIFNNVGSENHGRILRQAVEAAVPEVRVLGCIPRDEGLRIPSRHLGLVTAEESALTDDFRNALASTIEEHVDLEGLLSLRDQVSTFNPPLSPALSHEGRGGLIAPRPSMGGVGGGCNNESPGGQPPPVKGGGVKVAVARDEAFCFVYEDNLRLLREAGAEIAEFSPLRDQRLPEGIGGIYLPGGYPELFTDALAANLGMIAGIRNAVEAGMQVYAECGGFIYLTAGFAGIFPIATRMLPRRKALGYREVELISGSLIGPKGTVARGHEFHYSEMDEMPPEIERLYRVRKNGADLGLEGYRHRNCLASYIHLHFGSCPEMATTFVNNCLKFHCKQ
ncbi:MAG: cobyrinate a,c-diamide synthase [Geobacteraceae bacterium]|nr:cobyrinate a,c-diamide synthase [Geobacteraceae bacterium]